MGNANDVGFVLHDRTKEAMTEGEMSDATSLLHLLRPFLRPSLRRIETSLFKALVEVTLFPRDFRRPPATDQHRRDFKMEEKLQRSLQTWNPSAHSISVSEKSLSLPRSIDSM